MAKAEKRSENLRDVIKKKSTNTLPRSIVLRELFPSNRVPSRLVGAVMSPSRSENPSKGESARAASVSGCSRDGSWSCDFDEEHGPWDGATGEANGVTGEAEIDNSGSVSQEKLALVSGVVTLLHVVCWGWKRSSVVDCNSASLSSSCCQVEEPMPLHCWSNHFSILLSLPRSFDIGWLRSTSWLGDTIGTLFSVAAELREALGVKDINEGAEGIDWEGGVVALLFNRNRGGTEGSCAIGKANDGMR